MTEEAEVPTTLSVVNSMCILINTVVTKLEGLTVTVRLNKETADAMQERILLLQKAQETTQNQLTELIKNNALLMTVSTQNAQIINWMTTEISSSRKAGGSMAVKMLSIITVIVLAVLGLKLVGVPIGG